MRKKTFCIVAAIFFALVVLGQLDSVSVAPSPQTVAVLKGLDAQPALQAVNNIEDLADFLSQAETDNMSAPIQEAVRGTPLLLFLHAWLLFVFLLPTKRQSQKNGVLFQIFQIITYIHWIDGKKKLSVLITDKIKTGGYKNDGRNQV